MSSRRARLCGFAALLTLGAGAQEVAPEGGGEGAGNEKLLLYRVRGVLGAPQAEKLRRDVQDWLKREPEIRSLVLEIDSPGTENGQLEPALKAAQLLADLRGVRVVAWIGRDQVAGNASALLALASRDLVLSPGAKLGFIPNENARPPVEVNDSEEKSAQEARSRFREFSENRGGMIGRTHLASAMVSKFHPTIFKVKFERAKENNVEQEFRFLTAEEVANLSEIDKQLKKPGEFPVVPAFQKLTLDQEKAREYGFAVSIGSNDLNDLLVKLKLHVGSEDIIDHDTGGSLKPIGPAEQTLVDFLNHPVVRFFLILAGTLGLLLEIKMPGTMFPTMAALACFAVFFISGLFKPTGAAAPPTNIYEVLLFMIGLGLLAVELLLLPGVILFGLSGAAVCLISMVLAMVPPADAAVTGSMTFRQALSLLIASAGTSAVIFLALLRFLPHSRFLDRSGLVIHSSIQGTPTADTAIEAQTKAAALIGLLGLTLTPLRPAGTIEVAGQRLDVVTEGDFIEKGEKVQIIETDGTRTIVRKI